MPCAGRLGKYALSQVKYFIHRFCDCDSLFTEYSSQCDISEMSMRRLSAFSLRFLRKVAMSTVRYLFNQHDEHSTWRAQSARLGQSPCGTDSYARLSFKFLTLPQTRVKQVEFTPS